MQPINYLTSSWGLSADGDLKPDVTLPGGMIYSSVNNGEYYMDRGNQHGLPPHAAGATALVKQALKEASLILAQNNYRF